MSNGDLDLEKRTEIIRTAGLASPADAFPNWSGSRASAAVSALSIGLDTDKPADSVAAELVSSGPDRKKPRLLDLVGPFISRFIVRPDYNKPKSETAASASAGSFLSRELDPEIVSALFTTRGVARYINRHV